MTRDELAILTAASPDYPWERSGEVDLQIVGRVVPLKVLCDLDRESVTEPMAAALTELLDLDQNHWDDIASLMLIDAQRECLNTDLGFARAPGEDTTMTNRREIGLAPDGSAPEGWARADWIKQITVADDADAIEASLDFDVPWEVEHGFHVRFENGKFVAFNP